MSSPPRFDSLRVLVLESRRAREMAALVTSHGGQPISAPSMREVPLESNTEALAFADALERGEFDLVILLTGVGTRALVAVVEGVRGSREGFVEALRRTKVVARGPKPVAVLRELNVPVWLTAPEPNTWRELLGALDSRQNELSLSGLRVAVQEYGAANPDLLAGLDARGARVTRVPVYQWALPEDLEPLESACRALAEGKVDVVLFTTATQVVHLLHVAETMGLSDGVRGGLGNVVVASIGPTTSEELRQHGITPDLEPDHPKMGFLVREAASRAADLLKAKRQSRAG
jgi:uroporphyrinogen-III synthase